MYNYDNRINLFLFYEDFARRVFSYLKENLLSDFPEMQLQFVYDNSIEAVGCNYFNKITINLRAFESELEYQLPNMNKILYVMIHESFHQNQMYDGLKYKMNKKYRDFVECNADYSTVQYINSHERELVTRFGIPIYTYNVENVYNMYDTVKAVVPISKKNNDIVYFHAILSYYMQLTCERGLKLFYENENVIIDFITNNEKSVDRVTIKKDCVLDYDKMNYIMKHYMYDGFHDKIYKIKTSKNNYLVVSIYLTDKKVQSMSRWKL